MTQENTKEKKINRAIIPSGLTQLPTRFDRNLADNLFSFDEQYEKDATLIKNVAFYLAMQWQNSLNCDLSTLIRLDPKNLAEVMHYKDYRFLLNTHQSPLQFKKKSAEEIKQMKKQWTERNETLVWDTLLCNAIYTMKTQPLVLTSGGKTPNGSTFSKIETLDFFESIAKYRDPKSGKIHYEYELSPTFKNNLARYFVKLDADIYAQLRKFHLQDFYMRLSLNKTNNLENDKGNESFSIENIDLDYLCKLIRCTSKRFRDKKRRIVEAIDRINILSKYQYAKLTWEKGKKYKNRAKIEIFHTKSDSNNIAADHYQRFQLYTIEALKLVYIEKKEITKSDIWASNNFKSWLINLEIDFPIKKPAIEQAHILCFGKEIHADNLYKTYGNLPAMAKELPLGGYPNT